MCNVGPDQKVRSTAGRIEALAMCMMCSLPAIAVGANDGQDRLMNCQMPVTDGFDATRSIRMREIKENKPRVPIVALTANALPEDRELCIAAGMDDFLNKPYTMNKPREMVEHDLKESRMRHTS